MPVGARRPEAQFRVFSQFGDDGIAGNNAYFVRKDAARELPAPTVSEAYVESRYQVSLDEAGNLTFLSGAERVRAIAAPTRSRDVERDELVKVGDAAGAQPPDDRSLATAPVARAPARSGPRRPAG